MIKSFSLFTRSIMMRLFCLGILAWSSISGAGWAQTKDSETIRPSRLLILPFENRLKDQSPAIGETALDTLQTDFFQAKRPFQLIARRQMKLQLAELAFAESALSDPQKALQLGQLLSANLMLSGTIALGKIHTSEVTNIQPIKYTWATVQVSATLMHMETGEVLYSGKAEGRSSRYPTWQGSTYTSIISEAVAQASRQLATDLLPHIPGGTPTP
jgi:hypothetical protein